MQALAGPSGMWGAVVWMGWRPRWPPPMWRRWGWAVAIGHPTWMWVRGWRGPVAGSPWWAWVWVRISPVWVWVAMREALLVGRGLMMPLVLVVALVEGPVALQAVPRRGTAPASSMRGPRWAVEGRARRLVPRGARRTVPRPGAPVVWRSLPWRGPVVVTPVVVWWGEVSGGGRAQSAWTRGPVARLSDSGGVGDMWTGHSRGLGQLATASPRSAGPRGGGDRAAAHRTTALQQNVNKENQNAPPQQQQRPE